MYSNRSAANASLARWPEVCIHLVALRVFEFSVCFAAPEFAPSKAAAALLDATMAMQATIEIIMLC